MRFTPPRPSSPVATSAPRRPQPPTTFPPKTPRKTLATHNFPWSQALYPNRVHTARPTARPIVGPFHLRPLYRHVRGANHLSPARPYQVRASTIAVCRADSCAASQQRLHLTPQPRLPLCTIATHSFRTTAAPHRPFAFLPANKTGRHMTAPPASNAPSRNRTENLLIKSQLL